MNKKHRSTLKAVFKIPVQSGIPWKEIDKEALCDMCRFLITAGVKP